MSEANRPAHEFGSTVIAAADASYERLTPDNTALLFIDHQIGPLWELDFAETRQSVGALAHFAKRMRLPNVITIIAPESWGPVIPEISDVLEDASALVRANVNAWADPEVRDAIERTGRKKLIIVGGAGSVGVALCALSAVRAGYEVYAPIDASGGFSHPALACLAAAGVHVTTTALVTAEVLAASTDAEPRDRPALYILPRDRSWMFGDVSAAG